MRDMTTEQAAEVERVKAKRDQALQVVFKLAEDPERFSMSIPVQRDRDDDCVLVDAIKAVDPLLETVQALRDELAAVTKDRDELQAALDDADEQVSEVYCMLTNNQFSKMNTAAGYVLEAVKSAMGEELEDALKELAQERARREAAEKELAFNALSNEDQIYFGRTDFFVCDRCGRKQDGDNSGRMCGRHVNGDGRCCGTYRPFADTPPVKARERHLSVFRKARLCDEMKRERDEAEQMATDGWRAAGEMRDELGAFAKQLIERLDVLDPRFALTPFVFDKAFSNQSCVMISDLLMEAYRDKGPLGPVGEAPADYVGDVPHYDVTAKPAFGPNAVTVIPGWFYTAMLTGNWPKDFFDDPITGKRVCIGPTDSYRFSSETGFTVKRNGEWEDVPLIEGLAWYDGVGNVDEPDDDELDEEGGEG